MPSSTGMVLLLGSKQQQNYKQSCSDVLCQNDAQNTALDPPGEQFSHNTWTSMQSLISDAESPQTCTEQAVQTLDWIPSYSSQASPQAVTTQETNVSNQDAAQSMHEAEEIEDEVGLIQGVVHITVAVPLCATSTGSDVVTRRRS